jgi:hypothetical protein
MPRRASGKRCLCLFEVRKWPADGADHLVVLVAFARNQNDVARIGPCNRLRNRRGAIDDLLGGHARGHTARDHLDDRQR